MSKFNHILFFGFLFSVLSACNSGTKVEVGAANSTAVNTSKKELVNAKSADPIPQPGGYSNIDNAKLKELVNQGVVLVDIRRKEEWQQTGVVEGSKTITFSIEPETLILILYPNLRQLPNPTSQLC